MLTKYKVKSIRCRMQKHAACHGQTARIPCRLLLPVQINNSQDVIESMKARLPLVISGPLALGANCSVSKVHTWTTDLPKTDLLHDALSLAAICPRFLGR